jgi:uncharacterized protein (DUF1499 family)
MLMLKRLFLYVISTILVIGCWLGQPAMSWAHETPEIAVLPGFKSIFGGSRPTNLGVKNNQLTACPKSPNCVVSQGASDTEHAIAPLSYTGTPATAMAALHAIVAAQPGSEIISQTETYLYTEFTSKLMGFVDDVEFFLSEEEPGTVHVRSASRLGESDLGVNRQHIETIRAAFSG